MFEFSGDYSGRSSVPVTNSKNATLPHPHYTDDRFRTEQTVFGKEEQGLHYDYSDRIWQWDCDKAKEASAAASEAGLKRNTCAWYEKYLSEFHGQPVEIKHIMACFHLASGHPLYVFGYRFENE